ncbi:MAG: hypothetical protein M3R69_02030 [Acidobacteriota bacterium]|nr:hypothetical protein [Acidobacteriota bacterium]
MKQVIRSACAFAVLVLVFGAFSYTLGQTAPDPFVTQLTSSPLGILTNQFTSFAGGISGNGRFVVIESNGDIATEKTATRNNADGNREIFLVDYAQRRIFQITDTKSLVKPASPTPTPTPTPTPSASPTPTPTPTPQDPSTVAVEISNNRPVISNNGRWIAFSSNAATPGNYAPAGLDSAGVTALTADGNQEMFLYFIPATPDVVLSSGSEVPLIDLTAGTFTQITNTPASRATTPGGTGILPFVADDNRDASVNDNASEVAFVSTRNLTGGNADGNPEIFVYRRTPTPAFTQVTTTSDVYSGSRFVASVFNENPSLSGSGSVLAFLSNANLTGDNNDSAAGYGNAEIHLASYNAAAATASITRQVTKTKKDAGSSTVNLLSPGPRLSRDGNLIAFESLAADPKGNSATNTLFYAAFVYNASTDSFSQIGLRALAAPGDTFHFPTFTDYNASLAPATVVFTSALNFKTDGSFPAADQTSTGLNPTNQPQIFAATISSPNTFIRLTNNPVGGFGQIRPVTSNTLERTAFSLGGSELGGGNADASTEVFYLLSRLGTDSAAGLSFFTGASNFPVAAATPVPSPAASPTPTPTPGTIAGGLAAGELSIVTSSAALAPSDKSVPAGSGSETARSPILPIELNGVSVAVNGAAAGLYSVGDTEGIAFVMPVGLPAGVASVVVNNNGTTFRGFVQIVLAQPDIFPTSNAFGTNRAVICNVTNSTIPGCIVEPFTVTSVDSTGASVPTVLEIHLTGVRKVLASEVTVRIGTTDITPAGSVGPNPNMFGFDFIRITLPASLAGAGDVPVIVTITKSGGTFVSRASDTAPRIKIN